MSIRKRMEKTAGWRKKMNECKKERSKNNFFSFKKKIVEKWEQKKINKIKQNKKKEKKEKIK